MTAARAAAILVVLAFSLTAAGQRTAAQMPPEPAPLTVLVPGSAHGLVLGPERIVATAGRPTVVRLTVSPQHFEGPFVLYLRSGRTDGSGRVTAARLTVNGRVLLRESSFAGGQPGYVIAVALPDPSVVEVWLAGQPETELTLWIAGNPILAIDRDDADTVAQVVSSEGVVLARIAPDGTQYVLTIPPMALAEPHEIRLTPIRSIPNLPLSGGFRYGVHLEPDGLQLLQPASLEIRPPSLPQGGLIGFGYEGEGRGIHLRLSRTVDDAIRMPILHFSGAGVGAGTAEDVAQILSTSATDGTAAAYEAALAGLLLLTGGNPPSDELLEQMRELLQEWFDADVIPRLEAAIECGRTDCPAFAAAVFAAGNAVWRWRAAIIEANIEDDPLLARDDLDYVDTVREVFPALIDDIDARCRVSGDFCEQVALAQRALRYAEALQFLTELATFHVHPETLCGGVLSSVIHDVSIDPGALTIVEDGGYERATLIAVNQDRQPLLAPPGLHVTWRTDHPEVAEPVAQPGELHADVVGWLAGHTLLRASVVQCPGPAGITFERSVPVEVVARPSEIASVEVTPPSVTIDVGEVATVSVTARTASGEPVFQGAYLPILTPNAEGVVDLQADGAFLPPRWVVRVRGVSAGDVEVDVAVRDLEGRPVEGVRASFRVTVTGEDEPPPVFEIVPEEIGPFVAGERVFFSAPYVGSAPVTWQSSAPGVATVVGLFQGRAAMITTSGRGSTTITARVDSHEASIEIEVRGLALTPSPVDVEAGGPEQRIEAFVEDTGGSTFPVPQRIGLLEWRLRDRDGSWEDPAPGFSVESRGATEGAVFAERPGAAVVGAFFRRRLTITNPPPGMAADWGTYEVLGGTALVLASDEAIYRFASSTITQTAVYSGERLVCSDQNDCAWVSFSCTYAVDYDFDPSSDLSVLTWPGSQQNVTQIGVPPNDLSMRLIASESWRLLSSEGPASCPQRDKLENDFYPFLVRETPFGQELYPISDDTAFFGWKESFPGSILVQRPWPLTLTYDSLVIRIVGTWSHSDPDFGNFRNVRWTSHGTGEITLIRAPE